MYETGGEDAASLVFEHQSIVPSLEEESRAFLTAIAYSKEIIFLGYGSWKFSSLCKHAHLEEK